MAVMVVITDFFLEPCGLAHSWHPGAQHLKARVRPPHHSKDAAVMISSCNFFINVLSLARELEKNVCDDLNGVVTLMRSGIPSRCGGAVSLRRWYGRPHRGNIVPA